MQRKFPEIIKLRHKNPFKYTTYLSHLHNTSFRNHHGFMINKYIFLEILSRTNYFTNIHSIGTGVEDPLSSGLGGSLAFFNKYFPKYSKGLVGR